MHILWLTENYYPNRGGMAQSCDRIVHSLRQLGVSIDLVHFADRAGTPQYQSVQQGCNIRFPVNDDPAHTLNLLWNYLSWPERKRSYTHLLAFGGHLPILAGPVFAAWLARPLISCLRGNDVDTAIFTPRRRAVLREALQQSAAICSVSKDKISRLQAWLPAGRFHYTPSGIDLQSWVPAKSELSRARQWREQNVAPQRQVLGVLGHLKAKKGLDLLIQALDCRGLREHVHLLISGEVADEHWTEPLQQAKIAYTHIPFMDRYELLAWYPACDWVVVPSHYEGMPNILLEAGALGIPLIASRIDGMKDLITEEQHGFLFHPGERDDCRSALKKALGCSPAERLQIGAQLQTHIRTHYDQRQEAERYLSIFHSTLHIATT